MNPWIKICGITSPKDAELAAVAGADAIGVNLVPSSPRSVTETVARDIALAMAGRVEVFLVVADQSAQALRALRLRTGARWLQLHGDESPETLAEVQPDAIKAVRIGTPKDVLGATRFGGERLLVDARAAGRLGGSGQAFDWSLVVDLACRRRTILAGGLTPENVGLAVEVVNPWGLDVASGVEDPVNPRRKAPDRMRRFVELAHERSRA